MSSFDFSFGTTFEHHVTVIHFRELARTFKFELGGDEQHHLFVYISETEWRPPENASVHAPPKSPLSIYTKILCDQQCYYLGSPGTKSSFSRKYFNIVLIYPKSSAAIMLWLIIVKNGPSYFWRSFNWVIVQSPTERNTQLSRSELWVSWVSASRLSWNSIVIFPNNQRLNRRPNHTRKYWRFDSSVELSNFKHWTVHQFNSVPLCYKNLWVNIWWV